ncbi:DUF4331 domain-containing protein [bacterium]|nr:DUF4331 domain-containing protein [bacterium]
MKVFRALAAGLATAMMLAVTGPTLAADHLDSPIAQDNALADIDDVYSWMSPDAQRVNLVMTVAFDVSPSAQFSNAVEYIFRTSSQDTYEIAGAADATQDVTCTFDGAQNVTCTVGAVTVTGDASSETGITDGSGSVRVFAGARNDPFFFNFSGFRATAEAVANAAGSLEFDAAGCPTLDMETSNALVTQLQTEPDGDPAIDDFGGMNVLALVVSVDKALLTAGGPIVGVSGFTNLIGG